MDRRETEMYFAASWTYRNIYDCRDRTQFITGRTEMAAPSSAEYMNTNGDFPYEFEAYPCWQCSWWHIWKKLSEFERQYFFLLVDKAGKERPWIIKKNTTLLAL